MKIIKNITIIAVLIISLFIIFNFVGDALQGERVRIVKEREKEREEERKEQQERAIEERDKEWNAMTEEEQCEYQKKNPDSIYLPVC